MEHPRATRKWETLRSRSAAAIGQLLIILVGVVVALAADRWNQGRLDRASAGDYLASLVKDLREDTASLSAELQLAETREVDARLILGVVVGNKPIDDPFEFVLAVVNASMYGEPVQSRETFDDLVETGRLGLIRDEVLRRGLADYYHFVERRSQPYALQRQRVWGDYLPLSVDAVPLDLQEWTYRVGGRRRSGRTAAPSVDEAAAVAARLRAMPEVEKALKGVVRASWSLTDNWTLMRSEAAALIEQIEALLKGR